MLLKKVYESTILNYKIKKYMKNIKKEDIVICGRVDVALKIIKHIKE